MSDSWETVVVGVISGVASGGLGAFVTHLATRATTRLQLAAAYDRTLQRERREAYLSLWAHMEPVSRYGRRGPFTYQAARDLSDATRSWYYRTGGMYLTIRSRDLYNEWKEVLEPLAAGPPVGGTLADAVPDEALKALVRGASTLRITLSRDIDSRSPSRV